MEVKEGSAMNQIICPKCGEVFTIDESNYESIVRQVRDHQFAEEINRREKEYEEKLERELKIVKSEAENQKQLSLNEKDKIIETLRNELDNKDTENRLVTREALDQVKEELNRKEALITKLNGELKNKDTEAELAVNRALAEKEKEISELKTINQSQNENYRQQLADKDEMIAYYKDFKARQSTKMIGEDLEQHCSYEFNRVRPLFKNAYFEKEIGYIKIQDLIWYHVESRFF